MINSNLRIVTLALLRNRPAHIKLSDIENHTSLTTDWLKSFMKRGDNCDSGSDKIVTLYEYLTKSKIKI